MRPVGKYVTGLFPGTANQQVWHTLDVGSQGRGCARAGQLPAALPEQQQQLTGSVQGGHHPPEQGFTGRMGEMQSTFRWQAADSSSEMQVFAGPVLLAGVWFGVFCSHFASKCIHCWAGQSCRAGTSACTPWMWGMMGSKLLSPALTAPDCPYLVCHEMPWCRDDLVVLHH